MQPKIICIVSRYYCNLTFHQTLWTIWFPLTSGCRNPRKKVRVVGTLWLDGCPQHICKYGDPSFSVAVEEGTGGRPQLFHAEYQYLPIIGYVPTVGEMPVADNMRHPKCTSERKTPFEKFSLHPYDVIRRWRNMCNGLQATDDASSSFDSKTESRLREYTACIAREISLLETRCHSMFYVSCCFFASGRFYLPHAVFSLVIWYLNEC